MDWRRAQQAAGAEVYSPWRHAYNPIGSIFEHTARHYGLEQIGQLCDLLAIQRIVALQIDAYARGVTGEQIEGFIATPRPEYADPYTDQPFAWIGATHSLSFMPTADRVQAMLPWPL
jgi:hypothetical protein